MATNSRSRTKTPLGADAALAGILALLIDEREERVRDDKGVTRTEVLLANAGLSADDIQAVTGKTPDAVKKAIQRGKAK